MSPRIPDKSYVLVNTWSKFFKLKHGTDMLIQHPHYGLIIKTLSCTDKKGFYWFKGENEFSVSMSEIGAISKKQILGKVCLLIRRNN